MNEDKCDNYDIVADFLVKLGWNILEKPKIEDNYFDLTAVSDKKTLRVEIKTVQRKYNGSWQAGPISQNQLRADAIAVVLPSGSVFIEKTEEYLEHCSEGRTRQFTWLRP